MPTGYQSNIIEELDNNNNSNNKNNTSGSFSKENSTLDNEYQQKSSITEWYTGITKATDTIESTLDVDNTNAKHFQSKKDTNIEIPIFKDVKPLKEQNIKYDDIIELPRNRSIMINRSPSSTVNIYPKSDTRIIRGISNTLFSSYNMLSSNTDMLNKTQEKNNHLKKIEEISSKGNGKIETNQIDEVKINKLTHDREMMASIKQIDNIIKRTEDKKKGETKTTQEKETVAKDNKKKDITPKETVAKDNKKKDITPKETVAKDNNKKDITPKETKIPNPQNESITKDSKKNDTVPNEIKSTIPEYAKSIDLNMKSFEMAKSPEKEQQDIFKEIETKHNTIDEPKIIEETIITKNAEETIVDVEIETEVVITDVKEPEITPDNYIQESPHCQKTSSKSTLPDNTFPTVPRYKSLPKDEEQKTNTKETCNTKTPDNKGKSDTEKVKITKEHVAINKNIKKKNRNGCCSCYCCFKLLLLLILLIIASVVIVYFTGLYEYFTILIYE